ncbi:efflux transporter, outer membrane factor (OMF) lipo, NodT family protein [Paraburkholderia xenovorans LB400]|uniref:RND efflux system, outer membrane lipoprotein, NodT family n=1 Tax=Paraburkholderia xenovorans (strain LB400) TaxID=266265 RepID=Q13XH3_PARXL|nr:efflux transporter outer membrane subunit [Paraburkholderia xenovorans]ABE31216.1 RND efflux system, outer membrane lipoprotein, NodT family [Paraburkholderia xenovorans LB400]AIP32975.1 efflux transporter, outer membrane factor (OMF) lipo, NodT family protein [Paraburkholderia xenovorans LB400]
MRMPFIDSEASRREVPWTTRTLRLGSLFASTLFVAACAVGPDYHKPPQDIPATFKEGTDWQRAQVNPQGAISSTWWLDYHDDTLSSLVNQALRANQSIASAEAAYRLARATIDANVASLFPTVGVDASGSRSRTAAVESVTSQPYMSNLASVSASASWEVDLWGSVRREIESAKASAQASDAQLAGERLSIAASVAVDYFSLRQADVDIASLKQQQGIDARILEMDRAGFVQGTVSNDEVLEAQDTLELVIAELQATETSREQDEHAIAVLTGTPPASFALPPQPGYVFTTPVVPPGFPSQLLERRYDVVSAERTAAAANARIGVAKAAFFPTLTLSAQGGFEHNALANLFSVPNRFWTLGPDLAATIFDGGARSAAVHEAEATYDEQIATYRGTVLSAFQSVEDSLSSYNHLCKQEQAYANIYERNQRLFSSQQAQMRAGTTSEQALLTQQITLLRAGQSLRDTQAALTESSVTLVKNLGGGWQWDDARGAAVSISANAAQQSSDQKSGERSQ